MASLEFQDGLREDHEHIDTRGRTSIMTETIMSKVNFPLTLLYAMLRLILDVRACNGDELNFTADIIHELFDPCVLFRSHEIAWAFYFCLLAPGLPHYQIVKGHCGNHRPAGGVCQIYSVGYGRVSHLGPLGAETTRTASLSQKDECVCVVLFCNGII